MKRLTAMLLALSLLSFSGCSLLPRETPPPQSNLQTADREDEVKESDTEEQDIAVDFPEDAPYLAIYWQSIRDFRTLVKLRLAEDYDPEKPLPAVTGGAEKELALPIHDLYPSPDSTLDDYGYMLYDLNGDALPELFWMQQQRIVAVFTCYDGQLQLLDAYRSRYHGYLKMPGQLWSFCSGGAADSVFAIKLLQDGKLEEVYRFASENTADGILYYEQTPQKEEKFPISQERFTQLATELNATAGCPADLSFYGFDRVPTREDGLQSEEVRSLPYLQQVRRRAQPIYSGPGYDFAYAGTVEVAAVYTMTAEVTDREGQLWGRLKSGAGWINLTHIRNQIYLSATLSSRDPLPETDYHYVDADGPEYSRTVVIRTTAPIEKLKLYRGSWDGGYDTWSYFYSVEQLTPEKPLVLRISLPHDFSFYGFSYIDGNGNANYYRIFDDLSGEKPIGFSKLNSAPYIA